MEVEDWYLPVAQADITECSTYAVVCRLKSSPSYTITSYGGSFNHPCYPGVTVTIPKNAVARKTRVSLQLKVGVVNLRLLLSKLNRMARTSFRKVRMMTSLGPDNLSPKLLISFCRGRHLTILV